MMALRAGAEHVTAVDRWLYMALASKESLVGALDFRIPYKLSRASRLLLNICKEFICMHCASRHPCYNARACSPCTLVL